MPFPYMTYVPAMVFTGKFNLAGIQLPIPVIVGIQGIAVGVTIILSEVIYRASIRHFNGVGA